MLVEMFDQEIRSAGRYYQMGQGTRKSRLQVEYTVAGQPASMIQICDGFVYYRYRAMGEDANLDILFLDKLAHADRQALLADSQTWMATGGVASLLASLANNFDLRLVSQSVAEGVQTRVLQGRWNEQRLRRLLFGQIHTKFIEDHYPCDRLPVHIPASVEVHLSQAAGGPIFPSKIKFMGRKIGNQDRPDSVSLAFHSLKMLDSLSDETFRVQPGSIELSDLTNTSVERIEDLNQAVRSTAGAEAPFLQR